MLQVVEVHLDNAQCFRYVIYRYSLSQPNTNTQPPLGGAGFELVLFAGWGMIPTYAKKVGLGNEFYLMLALNM